MTPDRKEMLLTVVGEQTVAEERKDTSRTQVCALYENRKGVHVFRFRESDPQSSAVTESVLELSEELCRITRSGGVNVAMEFVPDREMRCTYGTPFGEISMRISTRHLAVREIGTNIHARIRYLLILEGADPMECAVTVRAEPAR